MEGSLKWQQGTVDQEKNHFLTNLQNTNVGGYVEMCREILGAKHV